MTDYIIKPVNTPGLTCDLCNRETVMAIQLGADPPEWDESTLRLCQDCIGKAWRVWQIAREALAWATSHGCAMEARVARRTIDRASNLRDGVELKRAARNVEQITCDVVELDFWTTRGGERYGRRQQVQIGDGWEEELQRVLWGTESGWLELPA